MHQYLLRLLTNKRLSNFHWLIQEAPAKLGHTCNELHYIRYEVV